jgi:hypothetical protein
MPIAARVAAFLRIGKMEDLPVVRARDRTPRTG